MAIGFLLASCCLASAFLACSREPGMSEMRAVAYEGRRLHNDAHEFGTIAPDRWPASISKLEPEDVYRTPAGLYIATDSFFVEERGLFVPDPATRFVPGRHSDPSYEPLVAGVFAYCIEG